MAWTAHHSEDQIREHFESPEVLDRKAAILAGYIKESKHCIFFTGAGVSTSAGIPDFRGPDGVWTRQAQGREPPKRSVSTLSAIPTKSHMAIVKLFEEGYVKYLVSQNVDGLHRKSGVLPQQISELHGNSNREECESCGKEYLRDYYAVASYRVSVHDHYTGRRCTVCGGRLKDTIVNFSEPLPRKPLELAYMHANKADLCVVLGSSLTVSPANDIPATVAKRGQRLVIVNLQKTPLDDAATLVIHGRTDDVMERVMRNLNLEIPRFLLTRRVVIGYQRKKLFVQACDENGTPMTLFRSVTIGTKRFSHEPFEMELDLKFPTTVNITLEFMGHYAEPNLQIKHQINSHNEWEWYVLKYDPYTRHWQVNTEPKKNLYCLRY